MDSNKYFEEKKALLKECVSLSEEMLSNINDIDRLNGVLQKRLEKIHLLQSLDTAYGKSIESTLSDKQKLQLNQMITLLLGLDRDVEKKIKHDQSELKAALKVNTQNHKLINYTGKYTQTSGRILDKKK